MECRQFQLFWMVSTAVALAACGGSSRGPSDGQRRGDGAVNDAFGAFQCSPDAGTEETLDQIAADGGVGLEQYVRAMATARCTYWSRCFGLAPYAANECVEAFVASGNWSYWNCPSKTHCAGTTVYSSAERLVQAVHAGTFQYDSQRAGRCVAALLAEGCAEYELLEAIPACAGVFTCPGGTDAGSSDANAVGADAGTSCAGMLPNNGPALRTCSSAADCAGAGKPQGPYCLAGFCSASPCSFSSEVCNAYAEVGQPCVNNAYGVIDQTVETAFETCAPGLACAGAADGGSGTCVARRNVGSPCTSLADCKAGLVCACGVCQIPPSEGACANGLCKLGVAYCDFDTNLCKPLHRQGDSCHGVIDSCGAGLTCDISGCVPGEP